MTTMADIVTEGIPSPSQSVWYLGPIPLRAYGIIIVTGIFIALWIGARRYRGRGGDGELVLDMALWVVPIGIIGARLYHVVTTPTNFFQSWDTVLSIFKIWEGGLAIWGGVTFGVITA